MAGTYEATLAQRTVHESPDPIIWDRKSSFRNQNYRLLHHQKNTIGMFNCRLLEASNLQRSYWSALALGPVKHLKLSKAHGAISAFCTFQLDYSHQKIVNGNPKQRPSIVSPVIQEDNNPVWDNFCFEFPLKKGRVVDGSRIYLTIRVEEESTKIDTLLPQGGTRLLGTGRLDLTELCLGETVTGQPLPGVRDVWVDLRNDNNNNTDNETTLGKVRVLISYTPCGLQPQVDDVVGLESFARRNPVYNSCRPVLEPLVPLTVLDKRGSYLLCEYRAADGRTSCVRLHRNAVFVIERKKLWDDLHNLALLPVDIVFSTPIGRGLQHTLGPIVKASSELAMPALLSFKLVWMATRTAGLGVLSGVSALGSTLWHEGSSSLTGRDHHHNNNHNNNSRHNNGHSGGRGTAQFVQL